VSSVRVEREQVFRAPVDEGFRLITDPDVWPSYWPRLVRVEAGSRWSAPGDRVRLAMRFLGREVVLEMALRECAPPRFVAYDSRQSGFPNARHERHFEPVEDGFRYRIVVEYESRTGVRGLFDRTLLRRSIGRTVRQTMRNLERLFGRTRHSQG
jgi:uncharacterized protein YndB with AHSA1/START domain